MRPTAKSKQDFFEAWDRHMREFSGLILQIDPDDLLYKKAFDWYQTGREIVKEVTDHVYPGETHEAE